MDQVLQALSALLAAALTAVVPPLFTAVRAIAEAKAQAALATVQARLGEGAARVAGEILAGVRANPDVEHATQAMVTAGARLLASRFGDTVARYRIPTTALEGMVAGELGKLGAGLAR